MQTKLVEQFVKTCAWRNVIHELGMTNINDREYWADLYDAVTGDLPYDKLPQDIQEAYDYMGEVEQLASDLQEAYAVVLDTLRMVAYDENGTDIISAISDNYMG